ncbi:MAG: bifunctional 5,10-methylenetetrahydrofolate dehydrogenase/5,10-methenyltetrahydrofolate cyclohydrolase [Eubacteriales bacterium]
MLINCKEISQEMLDATTKKWEALGLETHYFFAIVSASEDPASQIYMKHKKADATKCGIPYQEFPCNSDQMLRETLQTLNDNPHCIGMMLQMPLADHLQPQSRDYLNMISPEKDIDGLTDYNQSKICLGEEPEFYPCTAKGVVDLLKITGTDFIAQSPIAVIGRSALVGRPLISMLGKENATVIACHSKTQNLAEITKTCKIVISATGIADLITKSHLSEGAVGVDVGITRTEQGIAGDFAPSLRDHETITITPVPGGVGLLTRAELMNNVVLAGEKLKNKG